MAKKLQPIPTELILAKMRYENPWWVTGKIESDYFDLEKRLYFKLFYPLVVEKDVKRAVVLMGPRRVGKTVMMHHAIQTLLHNKKVPKDKICFINIENPLYVNEGLEQLFAHARTAVSDNDPQGWYVFFDEIQYLKDWERHLKVLVDSYPNTKFIVSGSAAAALKLKSNESGAGRFTDFMLPPLTFQEYIHLMGCEDLITTTEINWNNKPTSFFTSRNITEVNIHFIDYINFGGYPEVVFSEKIRSNPGRYIKSDIVDKVLLRDLPSLYGIQNVQELNSFFTTLAYYTGNEVSLSSLASSSGVDKNTLKKYLEYFEAAFLIKQIHRVDDSAKKFRRANFYKICLTNPSLRSALFAPLSPTDEAFGNMVETAIYSQWLQRGWFTPFYARWENGEVDIVGMNEKTFKAQWAVEIKWSDRYFDHPEELKSLISFCKNNDISSAIVTTISKQGVKKIDGTTLHFLPSALYAFTIGHNTLQLK